MTAAPHTASQLALTPLRAAHGVDAFGGDSSAKRLWPLTRNCSLSPRQVAFAYALLSTVSLVIALAFFAAGVPLVLLFCGLELLAVALALLMWARHVGEGEVVSLRDAVVSIDRRHGSKQERHEFPAAWTRVVENDACVLLTCGSRRIEVGAQVAWPLRRRFAQEMRLALATPAHS